MTARPREHARRDQDAVVSSRVDNPSAPRVLRDQGALVVLSVATGSPSFGTRGTCQEAAQMPYRAVTGISFPDGTTVEPGEIVDDDRVEAWMLDKGSAVVIEIDADGNPVHDDDVRTGPDAGTDAGDGGAGGETSGESGDDDGAPAEAADTGDGDGGGGDQPDGEPSGDTVVEESSGTPEDAEIPTDAVDDGDATAAPDDAEASADTES